LLSSQLRLASKLFLFATIFTRKLLLTPLHSTALTSQLLAMITSIAQLLEKFALRRVKRRQASANQSKPQLIPVVDLKKGRSLKDATFQVPHLKMRKTVNA
jgi:hypothetical protein